VVLIREQTLELLSIVHKISKAAAHADAFGDLPRAEFFSLIVIQKYDEKSSKDGSAKLTATGLARAIKMTNPAVSKLLRAMETKKYIVREQDEHDRRITYISLSPRGSEVISRAEEKAVLFATTVLKKLGDADAHELTRIVGRLAQILQEGV
jgi:DNA-binding MarR family transcriptional regulator